MDESTIHHNRSILMHLMSPLALAVPIILVTGFVGSFSFNLSGIPPFLAAGVVIIFCIMSGFYILLCRLGMLKPAMALGLATSGMMVLFFSFAFDSGIICNLVGFMTVIAGIFAGMSAAAPVETMFAKKSELIVPQNLSVNELGKIIDAIQFPCVFMERGKNRTERIVAYNQPFALEFDLDKSKILGSELDSLLPIEPDNLHIKHKGEEWVIKRTARGRQILTILSPAMRSKEAAKIEVFDAIDVSTGLYAADFMRYKARSDIESVNRGKRRLTAVVFSLAFPPEVAIGIPDEEQKLAFVMMGRTIQTAIRVCDSAYRISDNEVLLIMPDTTKSGASIVISRVETLLKQVSKVECPNISKAALYNVNRDYVGGADLPQHEKLLEEMLALLFKTYPELEYINAAVMKRNPEAFD